MCGGNFNSFIYLITIPNRVWYIFVYQKSLIQSAFELKSSFDLVFAYGEFTMFNLASEMKKKSLTFEELKYNKKKWITNIKIGY